MTNKEIRIAYSEYESIEQLEQNERELVEAAIEAINGSYAPYSKFNVGAAVRLDNGKIIKGANQENVAYPSGICPGTGKDNSGKGYLRRCKRKIFPYSVHA